MCKLCDRADVVCDSILAADSKVRARLVSGMRTGNLPETPVQCVDSPESCKKPAGRRDKTLRARSAPVPRARASGGKRLRGHWVSSALGAIRTQGCAVVISSRQQGLPIVVVPVGIREASVPHTISQDSQLVY